MSRPLTEKQRRFVEAYMGEARGNATEAASLAGYKGSRNTLRVVGAENLAKPAIKAAITERQENDPLVATREERQRFLTGVMRGELCRRPLTSIAGYVRDEDGEIVTEDPLAKDRIKAAETLCKMNGDFVDRQEGDYTIRIVREDA
ncbi:MAG: terminase small subunit [Bacteroidota bacterium]